LNKTAATPFLPGRSARVSGPEREGEHRRGEEAERRVQEEIQRQRERSPRLFSSSVSSP
jgi:hypothetical protein